MKNHLKRLTAPKTWTIDRKIRKFITRPQPGGHRLDSSLPLNVILRDFLKKAHTTKEAKKMLHHKQVLVDGKIKINPRLPVGLFDVISFPEIKSSFRILLDQKGRLIITQIDETENNIKPCKIIGKKLLSQKMQLNLHDGKNILVKKDFPIKVGDTVLITLPDLKIKETFPLQSSAFVFLTKGKCAGDSGILKEINDNQAIYQKGRQTIETLKKYLFVLGNQKAAIKIE